MTHLKSHHFLKTLKVSELLAIALPVSLQSLIQSILGMIDQVMVGQLGETALAGVSLGGRPCFIMIYTLSGITAAASIYASQYEGAKDKSRHSQVMRAALFGCLAVVIPFALVSVFCPHFVLSIFSPDENVISDGSIYLVINAISYIPLVFTLCCSALLRSTGKAKIPLITGFISVILNTSLNAVFIFGLFTVPAMGIKGAAIATVIARTVEAIILIIYMQCIKHPGSIGKAFITKTTPVFLKNFYKTALPVIGTELLWALGDAAYTVIYGHINTQQLAAMTLTFPIQSLTIGFFSGLAAASGIIIGNKLGAEETDNAYTAAWDFFKLSIAGCVIVALFIVLFSPFYLRFYNVTDEVSSYGLKLLYIFAFYLWIKVSNMVMTGGVNRSGGETKHTMMLDIIGTYGIGIPLGFISAFLLKLDIPYVYAIISIEEAVRLFLGLKRTASRKWMGKLN